MTDLYRDLDPDLAARLAFLLRAHDLRAVERANRVLGGARRENSAEHSWHAALFALTLAPCADRPIDRDRAVAMLLVHDVIEVECGDTPIFSSAAVDQEAREIEAAGIVFGALPAPCRARLRGLWDDFEAADDPEARFAKAIDRFQPILMNHATGGGTWIDYGVDRAREEGKTAALARGSAALAAAAQAVFDEAVAKGFLGAPGAKPARAAVRAQDWRAQAWLDAVSEDLARRCRFLLAADGLKQVARAAAIAPGARPENAAEHSWLAALAALVLEERGPAGVDVARARAMALVHDLGEIAVGDAPLFSAARDDMRRAAEERAAFRALIEDAPAVERAELRALMEEFEAGAAPTARYVAAIDRLLGRIGAWAAEGEPWRRFGVDRRAIEARSTAVIEAGLPALAPFAKALLDDAERRGFLPP